jgi:amino acid adenylation domain-containing protein
MKKSFLLSNAFFKQLEDFSQENQNEVSNFLLAGYAILLHRTQEQTEVRIATPRTHLSSNQERWQISFSKELTLSQLLDELQKPPAPHETSSADSYGVYYSCDSSENSSIYPPNSLWLSIQSHQGTLQGDFNCEGGLFSESDIELFASRFPVILEGMLGGANQICSEVPLLTNTEKQHLLQWNQNKVEYPKDACLHTLIEMQVERTPEAVAVSYQGCNVTYRELNVQANQIAHYLIQKKVGPGSLVGLYTDPSPRMLSAMLGILKTGAAYVCLDPIYPAHKLKFIAEECEISFLLTTSKLEKVFPVRGKPTLFLDDQRLTKVHPTTNPSLLVSSDAPVFIVYTSGSAGVPKGVIHSHRNIISRFHSTCAFAPTQEGEVYSQTSPLSSIDLIDEIYPPLMRGYRVQMIDMQTVRDPHLLVEALERGRVTRIVLVPSLLRKILSLDISLAHVLYALRVVLIGGEPLTYTLADLFYQKLPHAQLINFYGLTEGDGASYPVLPDKKISFAPPVGRPIANTKIYILDPSMELVPVGMSGEIYIANEGMATGYFKRPELDAQRFLPNPFGDSSEPRLYKTGDRGRFLSDGNIEYLGRVDIMVKIRGFRVELGAVEAAINAHPEVRECLVLARPSYGRSQGALTRALRLVGYVILKKPGRISTQTLKSYLRDQLPDYALPSALLFLESFPLSPAGKIDITALPDPDQVSCELDGNYSAPRDFLEVQLTRMWEKILQTSPIGVDDNFFDIGGDSLNAVDLFLQIEKDLHKDLPISVLMQAPTVAELAMLIRQATSSYLWSSLVPIQPRGTRLPLFCIHADGGVIVYKHFVHYLGPNQPIFGLQARGLLGTKDAPRNDIRQMASDYIQEMRTVQPTGPYQLCAFSMGGVIAFEMACQLRAAGEEVAFLGLLDTYSPGHPKRLPGRTAVQTQLSKHRGALSQYEWPQKLAYLRRRLHHRLSVIQSSLFGWIFVALRLPMPHSIRYAYVRQINEEAAQKYVPGKYPGTLTIFRAHTQPEGIVQDPYLGWEGHAECIELVHLMGSHSSIMQMPDLGELLKHVHAYLAEDFNVPVEFRESISSRKFTRSNLRSSDSIERALAQ